MIVNAFRQNAKMAELSKIRFQTMANKLLQEWDIFQDDEARVVLRTELTKLLSDTSQTWLSLLCFRNRICVSYEWSSQNFEGEVETQSAKVPGSFVPFQKAKPILRLCPAFLEYISSGQSNRPQVLHQGTALFESSTPLQAALNEEQEMRSPTLSNKEFSQPDSREEAKGKSR
jgi:hypothetical protein